MEIDEQSSMSNANRDANVLVALMAQMLRFISGRDFANVVSYWTANSTIQMTSILVEQKLLSESETDYIESLIEQTLEFHENDSGLAIESLGGYARVDAIIRQAVDDTHHSMLTTKLGIQGLGALDEPIDVDDVALDEKIGRYTRSREFSRGGMGRILLVHDELLLRDIALKELLPESTGSDDPEVPDASPMRQSGALMARFLREARITGGLEHPTIVPVYELGRRENGSLYYTMRLVRGKTMRTALEECKNLEQRLRILSNYLDLCMGIAYAHSKGIVHRDIKPSNVMIGEFGETVIIDWGLAKIVGSKDDTDEKLATLEEFHGPKAISVDKTISGERMGSPNYMSPEQAAGEIEEIDARSDVFSLGTLLYEILTNSLPFDGKTVEEIMEKVEGGKYKPVDSKELHLPKELISICDRALSKEKGDRYSSAKGLGEDIRSFMSGSMVSVYEYSAAERLQRFYKKYRTLVNLSTVFAILVLTISIASFVSISNSRDAALQSSRDEYRARNEAEHSEYLAQIRFASSAINSLNFQNAERVLWETKPSKRGWEWGYLLNQSRPELHRTIGYSNAALSPDGSIYVAVSRTRPPGIFESATGNKIGELDIPAMTSNSLEFSKDGKRLLIASRENVVQLWDVQTRTEIRRLSTPFERIHNAHYFPDERSVYSVSSSGAIRIWDTATGELKTRLKSLRGLTDVFVTPNQKILVAWAMDGGIPEPMVQAWDLSTYEKMWESKGNRPVLASESVLLSIVEGQVQALSLETGEVTYSLLSKDAKIERIAMNYGSRFAVTGDIAGYVNIWDLETNTRSSRNKILPGIIRKITLSSDGDKALVSNFRGNVALIEIPSGKKIREFAGHAIYLSKLQFSADQESALTVSRDDSLRIWPIDQPPGTRKYPLVEARKGASWDIRESSGQVLQGTNEVVFEHGLFSTSVFDENTGEVSEHYSAGATAMATLSYFTRNGRFALLTLDGFTCLVFDRTENKVVSKFADHVGKMSHIAAVDDLSTIVTAGWDGTIIFRDAQAAIIGRLAFPSAVTAMKFSPDRSFLYAGLDNGETWAIPVASIDSNFLIGTHLALISDLEITKDGSKVITTSYDRTAKIWHSDGSGLVHDLGTHRHKVMNATIDGRDRIVLTNAEYQTHAWDILSGNELFIMETDRAESFSNVADIFFNENRLFMLNLAGNLELLEAPPLDFSTDPADQQKQFEEYRKNWSNVSDDPGENPDPRSENIFLTRKSALDSLNLLRNDLLDSREYSTNGTLPGIALPENLSATLESSLRLEGVKSVVRIGDVVTNSVETFSEQIQTLIENIGSNTIEQFSMAVVKEETYSERRYFLVPVDHEERTLPIEKEILTASLQRFSDLIEEFSVSLQKNQREREITLGFQSESQDGILGFLVSGEAVQTDRNEYLALGFGAGDRISAVNGIEINDVSQLVETFRNAHQSIAADETDTFSLEIQRGNFVTVTLNLVAE